MRRRYPAASPVAYHAAVLANSCVVLHDAGLAVRWADGVFYANRSLLAAVADKGVPEPQDVVLSVCSLSLVFTVYRIRAATRAVSAEELPEIRCKGSGSHVSSSPTQILPEEPRLRLWEEIGNLLLDLPFLPLYLAPFRFRSADNTNFRAEWNDLPRPMYLTMMHHTHYCYSTVSDGLTHPAKVHVSPRHPLESGPRHPENV